MSKTYNWAILGCGKIARKFATDLSLLPNARLYAAASWSMMRKLMWFILHHHIRTILNMPFCA